MNNRLTIQDLAGLLAQYTGKDKGSTERFLREFIAVVTEGVYADKIVKVKGLGTFKIIPVEKRESIHVNTGERFLIPEHYKFSFLPDKDLRELVNKPFSFFETTELSEDAGFTDLDISEEAEDKEAEDESVEEMVPEEKTLSEDSPTDEIVPEAGVPECVTESGRQELTVEREEQDLELSEVEEIRPEPEEIRPEPEMRIMPVETPGLVRSPSENEDEKVIIRKSKRKINVLIILIVILLAASNIIIYLYRSQFFERKNEISVLQKDSILLEENRSGLLIPEEVEKGRPVAQADTGDTVEVADAFRPDTVPSAKDSTGIKPEPAASPEVIAHVKIEAGSRLTLIALKYYGSKHFWVYLYDYNKSKIKDPNNIPIGTLIEVPAPRLYGIDAHDRASVGKAAALQTEILGGQ